jgi:hypothetical protein
MLYLAVFEGGREGVVKRPDSCGVEEIQLPDTV